MRHPITRSAGADRLHTASTTRRGGRVGAALAAVLFGALAAAPPAGAQELGTFTWAVQPYCNVVSLTITRVGSTYRLEGSDDQCGAATRASVIGTAFANPDGTVGLGFNIVATPGGSPVHVDATISPPTFSGTWRDSSGANGPFAFSPALPAPGAPRPVSGGLGASAIDAGEVQRRVSGACAPGSSVRVINEDGSVVCETDSAGTGDITNVIAGVGLSGGGLTGAVTIDVDFAGSGSALTAARSDHDHRRGTGSATSTAVGRNALDPGASGDANTTVGYTAGTALTTGELNTAVGGRAFDAATTASENTAVGASSLGTTTTGDGNVAVGFAAAFTQTTGADNTAVGRNALREKTTGNGNTAVGSGSLRNLATGGDNIAIGVNAGITATGGSSNILIGSGGVVNETGAIRIGGAVHTATYVRGILGVNVGGTGVDVFVNSNHQLGTMNSSRRFKYDIADLADGPRLHALRPVSFRYLPSEGQGDARQFGLIAEEVDETMPELVVRDDQGQVLTVRYSQLTPLLLAEVQRLERDRTAQAARIDALEHDLAALRTALRDR